MPCVSWLCVFAHAGYTLATFVNWYSTVCDLAALSWAGLFPPTSSRHYLQTCFQTASPCLTCELRCAADAGTGCCTVLSLFQSYGMHCYLCLLVQHSLWSCCSLTLRVPEQAASCKPDHGATIKRVCKPEVPGHIVSWDVLLILLLAAVQPDLALLYSACSCRVKHRELTPSFIDILHQAAEHCKYSSTWQNTFTLSHLLLCVHTLHTGSFFTSVCV